MPFDSLLRNTFIKTLYPEAYNLDDVKILLINVSDQGQRVTLSFDMPDSPKNAPDKWVALGYNTVCVTLDFFHIHNFDMRYASGDIRGSIRIQERDDGWLAVVINGGVNLDMVVESGMIQTVKGYIDDRDEMVADLDE